MKKNLLTLTFIWIYFFQLSLAAATEIQVDQGKFLVGEKMIYSIKYMGLSIGKAEAFIKEIATVENRKAYHVIVRVKSNPIVDLIYKVRGEHHSYLDVEKLHSLRYEVWQMGNSEPDYVIHFDHAKKEAQYFFSEKKKTRTFEMFPDSQDQLSLVYVFRTLPLQPNKKYILPLHADSHQWSIQIKTGASSEIKYKNEGLLQVLEIEPKLDFINALVKKGQVKGRMTLDNRRIPLDMSVRVPYMGSLKTELIHYSTDSTSEESFS